ncbi:MAG: sulfatase-like hydrolase/transferase [Candidatus Marinimicrobia bacterium]|nr:sulfatase-like hydrolase/transferase [Candidatus Neomarinimicrobiota bacterium]
MNPHIFLVVIDTLRGDYANILEETLKRFGFVSYKNVIAPSSWTLPSHASIFTGLYPALHGAHETPEKKDNIRLNKKSWLLNVELSELGYTTFLITANPFISPIFGFVDFNYSHQTSHTYRISILSKNEKKKIENLVNSLGNNQNNFAIAQELARQREWKLLIKSGVNYILTRKYAYYMYGILKRWPTEKGSKININQVRKYLKYNHRDNESKFFFVNFMEVHEPYFIGDHLGEAGLRENLRANLLDYNAVKKWQTIYPLQVEYMTKRILNFLSVLKEKKIFDNSLIIITSDHGQLLGEQGRISHGTFLYDELLKVPLLVKYPKGYEVEHIRDESKYVSLIKLKPFILDIINNKLDNDSILYEDTVFAESYGTHIKVVPRNDEELANIEGLEKYRIALYYKSFKGIFNVTDWRFEEIISYRHDVELSNDIMKKMKKEVIKFLRTKTLAKVPRITYE